MNALFEEVCNHLKLSERVRNNIEFGTHTFLPIEPETRSIVPDQVTKPLLKTSNDNNTIKQEYFFGLIWITKNIKPHNKNLKILRKIFFLSSDRKQI